METFRRVNQVNDSLNEDLSVSDHSFVEHLITEGNYPISEEDEHDTNYGKTKDRSRLCFVCDGNKIDIFFNCGNGLCSECILEHIKAQIEKYKVKILSEKITFVCAGSCKCPVAKELMERFMDSSTKEKYHEVLLTMYLSKSQDVISCPRSDCKGYGFIKKISPPGIFNNIIFNSVNSCYECPVCQHKFSNLEENVTDLFDPKKLIKTFSFSNIKSQIKKYSTTKYCNKCNAPIEKAEGCKHIECNRCEYSFCWKCTEDWSTHVEKSCMGQFTNDYDDSMRPNFMIDLLMFLSILFTFKFLFTFTIIFRIIYVILKIGLFLLNLAVDAFMLHGVLLFYYKFKNRKKFLVTATVGVLFEALLYYFKLHIFSENLYLVSQIIVLPMYACFMAVNKKFN
jgi:hypothetical protein